MPGYPVVLTINAPVTHRPFGELMGTVEINNSGSNGWIVINGQYMAGPYQQNVVSLQSPGTSFDLQLTSTAAPGQTNPGSPAGTAVVHFYPFQPAPGGAEAPPANPGVIVGGTGWGAGSPGNTLQALTAGQSFTIDQVNQLINLLTGIMTGQIVTIANSGGSGKIVLGGLAGDGLLKLIDAAGHSKGIFCDANSLFIHNSADSANLLKLDDAGNLTLFNDVAGKVVVTQIAGDGLLKLFDALGNNKGIFVDNNALFIHNSAGSVNLLSLDDSGQFSLDGLNLHHFEGAGVSSSSTGDVTVTFSKAFTGNPPTITVTTTGDVAANQRLPSVVSYVGGPPWTGFNFNVRDSATGNRTAQACNWMAFARTT